MFESVTGSAHLVDDGLFRRLPDDVGEVDHVLGDVEGQREVAPRRPGHIELVVHDGGTGIEGRVQKLPMYVE